MRKIGLLIVVIAFFVTITATALPQKALNTSLDPTKIFAVFTLDKTNGEEFWAHITLENHSEDPLAQWQLGFTFQRIIHAINGAKIIEQVGDYYLIGSDQTPTISPGGSFTFQVQGQYTLRNHEDLPLNYFLILQDDQNQKSDPMLIGSQSNLLPYKPNGLTPGIDDYELNIQHSQTSIEGNPLEPVLPLESSLIVPLPVELVLSSGNFTLKSDTIILIDGENEEIFRMAEWLCQSLKMVTGYPLKVQTFKGNQQPENSIFFTLRDANSHLGEEGYILTVTPEKVTIQASGKAGLFYGMQSLKQLFPPEIWREKLSDISWQIPALTIKDYPRFVYRGVLLDSARHFFTTHQIKRLLDLMAMHKLNRFHWHLTDDEGWRIQILRYPTLTEIGAWRGYGLPLPPALGDSFTQRYGGFYTQDEIRDIVQYAQQRYITIIPEIDMPAHSRALIKSLPEQLQDPNDHTVYSSVRGFHDNVLSPCLASTYEVVNHIMDEVVALFPGSYIHIGSDEKPKNAWQDSPGCLALMKKEGFNNSDELQSYFVNNIQEMLTNKNKSVAVWEEAVEKGQLKKNPMPMIYSWKGVEAGIKAAGQGYDVVMSPASSLYLELAYSADPVEPGDYWGGYVDTFTVYAYRPIPQLISPDVSGRIKGIEGALWSEYIGSPERLDYFAFPKLSALAEVAWTPAARRNWINFSTRMGRLHLPRLDQYGVYYRISPPAIRILSHELHANNEFSSMPMRYTLDGTAPTHHSNIYQGPVKVSDELIKIRTFNTMGRGSRIIALSSAERENQ